MQRLLIVGAGYVGMALLKELQTKPYEISITTTSPERVNELKQFCKRVLLLKQDGQNDLEAYIEDCDCLIILVASKHTQTYEETYLNTAKRISASLKNRTKPLHLIYTSSTSVCDGAQYEPVTEETPLNPLSENAKLLLETENVYLKSSATSCILRLGGIYGPKRELIDRARRFSGVEMQGNGDKPTNNIHLEDIVSALLFSIQNSLFGIYHLVSDDHLSRRELYDTLCASRNLPRPLWNSESKRERGCEVSNQKIKDCGFTFKHPKVDLR